MVGWLVGDVARRESSYLFFKDELEGTDIYLTYDGVNLRGIDQELVFGYDTINTSRYIINVRFYQAGWPDNANEVILWRCSSLSVSSCMKLATSGPLGFTLEKNKEYKYRFVFNDDILHFYIDDIEVLNFSNLSSDELIGKIGFWNWGGDYSLGTLNKYDNFSINIGTTDPVEHPTSIPSPTPTLTPTPTPILSPTPTEIPKKMKVFILPGLGASWNPEAIVYNKQVGIGDWSMTPFVKNYDGLIQLLENNGLIRDQDFYVWNYDWRKSVGDIENDFNSFIGSKSLDGNDEIYLVGHSLGGVVARLWAQDNKNDNRIKQVINLGSPNLGSLDSYSVWNGGEVLEYDGVSSVAFQILLGLQNKSFLVKNIDKIRDYAPVVKDLLPIFDYVIKNNKSVSWNKLSFVNNYLSTKNNNISDVSDRLVSFIGTGNQTPKTIKLGARSIYDKVMNLWPDGEILSLVKSDGDGTVLTNSSGFGTLNKREVVSTHEEITNKSLLGIADVLSLGNRNVDFEYTDNFENSLVVFIGSPAKAELNCDGDTYYEDNGFIVAKDKSYSDCDLKLSPTNNGLVHVVLGNTSNNYWNYFEKEVKNEVIEIVKVDFKYASIANDKDNENFLRNQIKFDLETLKLSKVIKFLNKNDFAKVAVAVFGYREKNNEREITQRILDNLFKLSLITGLDKKKDNYKLLSRYVDLIELSINVKSKKKPISDESGASLVRLGELEGTVKSLVKQKDYPNYSLVWVLANGYGFESLLR